MGSQTPSNEGVESKGNMTKEQEEQLRRSLYATLARQKAEHKIDSDSVEALASACVELFPELLEKTRVDALKEHFTYEHLPAHLQEVSKTVCELARHMIEVLPPGPELEAGLRRLLEAKDCFVRAKLQKR
jgi:hypothetical protein